MKSIVVQCEKILRIYYSSLQANSNPTYVRIYMSSSQVHFARFSHASLGMTCINGRGPSERSFSVRKRHRSIHRHFVSDGFEQIVKRSVSMFVKKVNKKKKKHEKKCFKFQKLKIKDGREINKWFEKFLSRFFPTR